MAKTDIYTWHTIFHDDTTLNEFDDNPDGRGFADVEKTGKKVRALELWGQAGQPLHRVDDIPDGAIPVCLRRRTIEIDPAKGMEIASLARDHQDEQARSTVVDLILSDTPRSTVHCIGWKSEETAKYLFVFPDNSTLLTDDFNAV